MGRTLPTFRNVMESEILKWKGFRKALRKSEQDAFDSLMNSARNHASASSYLASLNPTEPMFLAMLLEQEKRIRHLEKMIFISKGGGKD